MLFDQQLAILLYIVQASPVTFYRLNFPVTSVSSSRTWLVESGDLISHGMFGAPDLRIITICRAGAPFLATDFPWLSFRQPLRRPFGALSLSFPGNCPLCGCLGWQWTGERWLQTVAQQCELWTVKEDRGFLLAANKEELRSFFLHFRKYWQFLSVPWKMATVHVDKPLWVVRTVRYHQPSNLRSWLSNCNLY